MLLPTAALADDYPMAQCALNDDASSVIVTAANDSDLAYKCMVSCRANTTGQRAFTPITCNFNLSKNAKTKTVCTFDGGAPKFYSAISPTKYTCVPR